MASCCWALALLLLTALQPSVAAAPTVIARSKVFVAGQDGHAAYRIPGVVAAYPPARESGAGAAAAAAQQPVLLAYAEGRKNGCGDYDGQHDLVLKRSLDNGATWGPMQVVADAVKLFNCTGWRRRAKHWLVSVLGPDRCV
jgi:sialidase-1